MNLEQLREQFRADADDLSTPPLFADEDVDRWHNEAEEEAAVRADLLFEADDAALCQVAVVADTRTYALSPLMLRVTYASFTPTGCADATEVKLIDRIELDRIRPNWRSEREDPRFLIVEPTRLRLGSIPCHAGVLRLEGYRLPLEPMASDAAEPEIPAAFHRHLVQWVLYRAYSKPDSETRDPGRAAAALEEFERMFGPRPDADLRRAQEAGPAVNKIPF